MFGNHLGFKWLELIAGKGLSNKVAEGGGKGSFPALWPEKRADRPDSKGGREEAGKRKGSADATTHVKKEAKL